MKNDFKNYAVNHLGIPSTTLDSYENSIVGIQTPSIVEERPMNMSIISVFDRLMKDKIIYLTGTVNDQMANIISAQLQYLDTLNTNEPITFMVNSGGGSVYAGLSILDTINLSKTQIFTTCYGMAASMMSVILGAGLKGERGITRFSKVMLHQSSGGSGGNIQDAKVAFEEWNSLNEQLFDLLGEYTNKTSEQVKKDASRDLWLNSTKALEYGIVDKIYWSRDKIVTLDNLHEVKK
jgi:ATP-dependent Clp protease protease subunit